MSSGAPDVASWWLFVVVCLYEMVQDRQLAPFLLSFQLAQPDPLPLLPAENGHMTGARHVDETLK